MKPTPRNTPDLQVLVSLFYDRPECLGQFVEVTADEMPADYRRLLAHDEHMTVTVESFHHSPVDVRVLATEITPTHYSRKILLQKQTDGVVVQFGIVRLSFEYLSDEVRKEIESQCRPLGRILIQHNVLRQVELISLWRLMPGEDLCRLFDITENDVTYGRTALIYTSGEPAVELLEIVTPASRWGAKDSGNGVPR